MVFYFINGTRHESPDNPSDEEKQEYLKCGLTCNEMKNSGVQPSEIPGKINHHIRCAVGGANLNVVAGKAVSAVKIVRLDVWRDRSEHRLAVDKLKREIRDGCAKLHGILNRPYHH